MENNNLNTQPTETIMKIKPRRRIWRIVRWPLAVILVLYVGLVIYRIPAAKERLKTQEVVTKIHAQKLTLADVMGQSLPPEPDPALKDATIEGIDANRNGIRDDVELAIFKLYPDSARIRAAELQYAMALQNEMTSDVFNSETLVAVLQEKSRASLCVADTVQKINVSDNNETINKALETMDTRKLEVENLSFNTNERKAWRQEIREKYMTSYGDVTGPECDIDLISLAN